MKNKRTFDNLVRRPVLERDKYVCQYCYKQKPLKELDAYSKVGNVTGGTGPIETYRTLCHTCYKLIKRQREAAVKDITFKLTLNECFDFIELLKLQLYDTEPKIMDKESSMFLNRIHIKNILLKVLKVTKEVVRASSDAIDNFDTDTAKFTEDRDIEKHFDALTNNELIELVIKINLKEFLALKQAIIYQIESHFDFLEDFVINGIERENYDWSKDVLRTMRKTRHLMNVITEQVQEEFETQLKVVSSSGSGGIDKK